MATSVLLRLSFAAKLVDGSVPGDKLKGQQPWRDRGGHDQNHATQVCRLGCKADEQQAQVLEALAQS